MAPLGPPPYLPSAGFTGLGRFLCDKLDRGVLMLDADGVVVDGNLLALDVLRSNDGMYTRGGRLAFSDRRLDQRLQAMIASGRSAGPADPAAMNGSVSAARSSIAARLRRSETASYRVVVTPVPTASMDRNVAYVVLIYAPNQRREISSAVLAELYGLTRAQSDVARSLYAGRSVEETARALGLSPNTVRSHMKQIFTKCEVQSQAELMQLLALGPHAL